jgi:hypothetical protein
MMEIWGINGAVFGDQISRLYPCSPVAKRNPKCTFIAEFATKKGSYSNFDKTRPADFSPA